MNEKVLVVDDNPDILNITRTALEKYGFAVTTAASGLEAITYMKADRPDAVVLDIMMPEMSGWEVLDYIKNNELTAKLPVLILTARDQASDIRAGYEYGADYYLTKPCSRRQLLYALGMLLNRADLISVSEQEPTRER